MKQKEKSEVEYLRAENRKLKSELRHLKKQLGKSNKKVKRYENHIDLVDPEISQDLIDKAEFVANPCPRCGSPMKKIDLGIKFLYICEDCNIRESVKKNGS